MQDFKHLVDDIFNFRNRVNGLPVTSEWERACWVTLQKKKKKDPKQILLLQETAVNISHRFLKVQMHAILQGLFKVIPDGAIESVTVWLVL